jgi:hypothetical protein
MTDILGILSIWLEVNKLGMITEGPKLIRYRTMSAANSYARYISYEKTYYFEDVRDS